MPTARSPGAGVPVQFPLITSRSSIPTKLARWPSFEGGISPRSMQPGDVEALLDRHRYAVERPRGASGDRAVGRGSGTNTGAGGCDPEQSPAPGTPSTAERWSSAALPVILPVLGSLNRSSAGRRVRRGIARAVGEGGGDPGGRAGRCRPRGASAVGVDSSSRGAGRTHRLLRRDPGGPLGDGSPARRA
jgi:hypothetical protein